MLDKQQFNRFFFFFLGYTELCCHRTQEYLKPFSNQEAPQEVICRSSDCKQSINDEDLKSEISLLSTSLEDNHVFSRTFTAPHSSHFLLTIWPGLLNQLQLTSRSVFSLKFSHLCFSMGFYLLGTCFGRIPDWSGLEWTSKTTLIPAPCHGHRGCWLCVCHGVGKSLAHSRRIRIQMTVSWGSRRFS